ncbi:perlucin-like protein [Ptychodera flava]|uniref:perlucin-like protein n=1 Tax=Ptychodera flava TaxID=63121 RepID=UPI00396A549A
MILAAVAVLSLFAIAECNEYGPLCAGKRFMVYTDHVFWKDAKASCESKGGELAKITDRETDEMIKNYIQETGIIDEIKTGLWIGLTDWRTEDTFKWGDGEKLLDCGSYSNWSPGEPNNNVKKNEDGQDCVQLWKRRNLMWDDEYCEYRKKGYVCMFYECGPECLRCAGIEETTSAPTLE